MRIGKRFTFDAAHFLPNYDGKCRHLHGHTYVVDVEVEGAIDSNSGMVLDLVDLTGLLDKYKTILDHQLLNDVFGELPTVENITQWLAVTLRDLLRKDYPGVWLNKVRIYENYLSHSYAEWSVHDFNEREEPADSIPNTQ